MQETLRSVEPLYKKVELMSTSVSQRPTVQLLKRSDAVVTSRTTLLLCVRAVAGLSFTVLVRDI